MNLSIKPHQYIFLGFLTQTLNKTKANTPTQRFRTQWALWYLTTSAMVRNSRYSRSDYFPLITAITESHSTNLRWMCSEWYSFIVMFIICLYDIIWYYMILYDIIWSIYTGLFYLFSHSPIWFKHVQTFRSCRILSDSPNIKHPDPWRIHGAGILMLT